MRMLEMKMHFTKRVELMMKPKIRGKNRQQGLSAKEGEEGEEEEGEEKKAAAEKAGDCRYAFGNDFS
jgi:hypothetical protein